MGLSLDEIEDFAARGIPIDAYLSRIANQYPSHRFLDRNIQLVYQRHVRFVGGAVEVLLDKPSQAVRVLDWGCGKGHVSYLLRREGFQVTSCDVVSHASDSSFGQGTPIIIEQHIEVVPLRHPVDLPFADGSFDVALSMGVLEHVHDDLLSLRELRRVVRPGGLCFVFFLPYVLSWTQRLAHARGDYYHARLYSRRQVKALAADAGFRVLRISHGQLFPKNSVPLVVGQQVEAVDRWLCRHTWLRRLATNLEVVVQTA